MDFVGLAVAYGLLAILSYLPFYIGFSSQAGGILPSMSFYTRGIHFWIMFAPLLIPIGIFVIWHFRKNWQKSSPDQAFKFAVIITGGLWVFSFILGWIGSRLIDWGTRLLQGSGSLSGSVLGEKLVTMGGLYANLQGSSDSSSLLLNALVRRMASPGTWLTLFLLILFIWAGLSIYKKAHSHNDVEQKPKKEKTLYAFVLVMMLIGAGLTMVPEFIYLRDQFGSRMNTIFKFYFQTWIFWSLAAAFAVVVLFRSLPRIAHWVFRIGIYILLLLSLAYPFWGLWTKTDHFNFQKSFWMGMHISVNTIQAIGKPWSGCKKHLWNYC